MPKPSKRLPPRGRGGVGPSQLQSPRSEAADKTLWMHKSIEIDPPRCEGWTCSFDTWTQEEQKGNRGKQINRKIYYTVRPKDHTVPCQTVTAVKWQPMRQLGLRSGPPLKSSVAPWIPTRPLVGDLVRQTLPVESAQERSSSSPSSSFSISKPSFCTGPSGGSAGAAVGGAGVGSPPIPKTA